MKKTVFFFRVYEIQFLLILILFSFILIVHRVLRHFKLLSGFDSLETMKKKLLNYFVGLKKILGINLKKIKKN